MDTLLEKNIKHVKRICRGFLPSLGDESLFDDYVQAVLLNNCRHISKQELSTIFIKRDILDIFKSKFYKHRKKEIPLEYIIDELSYSSDLDLKIDVKNLFNK